MERSELAQMDYENVGTIKTDFFSSPVPSKPPQRRESGPRSFDSLEGLHPNLLKKPCCLSLPLTQLWQLYNMHAFNPLLYFLTQTSALHSTQGKLKHLPGNQTLRMTKENWLKRLQKNLLGCQLIQTLLTIVFAKSCCMFQYLKSYSIYFTDRFAYHIDLKSRIMCLICGTSA